MRSLIIGTMMATATLLAAGPAGAQDNPLAAKAAATDTAGPADLVTLGDLYVEANQLKEAKDSYRAALKLEKGYADAEFGMARILMAKGKLEGAKKECRGVWRRHKSEPVGEICSGWVWLTFDRSTRAMDEFNKAVDKGDKARAKAGIAEVKRRRGENADAIADFRAAISAGAGYEAQIGLALSLEANGDNAGAIAAAKNAVTAQPASCKAHYQYGRLLAKGPEAASHMRTAIAIRPDWVEAHEQLGEILLAENDFTGAKKAFDDAIAATKQPHGTSYLGLGKALHGLNQPEEAKKALKTAIELVPNLVDAYLLVADIEYANGSADTALEALEEAEKVAPGIPRVYLHTGQTYFRLGRFTKARSYLTRAVSLDPKGSLAHVYLGDIACERHLYKDGHKHYDDALGGDLKGVSAADIKTRKAQCKSKH